MTRVAAARRLYNYARGRNAAACTPTVDMVNDAAGADRLDARIGSLAVYATPAHLVALYRTRAERVTRVLLTFGAVCVATPLGFLIPPHLEPAAVIFLFGLYFVRRAWVGEWELVELAGTCPRCGAEMTLKRGTVLYLPHTLQCSTCRTECWLELGVAPEVEEATRRAAIARAGEPARAELGGRPPLTWSPAASDWRDRRRN